MTLLALLAPRSDRSSFRTYRRAWEQLTGYERVEVLGRNSRFLQGAATEEGAIAQMVHALRDRKPSTVIISNYTKGGKRFRNALTLHPVCDTDGKYRYCIGIASNADAADADAAVALLLTRKILPSVFEPNTAERALAAKKGLVTVADSLNASPTAMRPESNAVAATGGGGGGGGAASTTPAAEGGGGEGGEGGEGSGSGSVVGRGKGIKTMTAAEEHAVARQYGISLLDFARLVCVDDPARWLTTILRHEAACKVPIHCLAYSLALPLWYHILTLPLAALCARVRVHHHHASQELSKAKECTKEVAREITLAKHSLRLTALEGSAEVEAEARAIWSEMKRAGQNERAAVGGQDEEVALGGYTALVKGRCDAALINLAEGEWLRARPLTQYRLKLSPSARNRCSRCSPLVQPCPGGDTWQACGLSTSRVRPPRSRWSSFSRLRATTTLHATPFSSSCGPPTRSLLTRAASSLACSCSGPTRVAPCPSRI